MKQGGSMLRGLFRAKGPMFLEESGLSGASARYQTDFNSKNSDSWDEWNDNANWLDAANAVLS